MLIELKSRWDGKVLFSHEAEENSVKLTLEMAVKAKVNLSGANLSGADLRGADLRGAYLSGADLSGANLIGAYLRGAILRGANLEATKADFIAVIEQAPNEVPALISALQEGRVDGSTYSGECSCLVGTIATAQGLDVDSDEFKIKKDSSRPAERFFLGIRKGDTPENNPLSKIALGWAKDWLAKSAPLQGTES